MKSMKEKILKVISEKQMHSVMNNTKWMELQRAVKTLPFPPPYQMKYVDMETLYPETFTKNIWYWGDWSNEALIPFYAIEWVRVQPIIYKKHTGMLTTDEIIDETKEFVLVLNKYSIPYEEENGTYIIYGYKR